jgi:PIN domain nuclease of toxin-antitoxin system
MRLLLDSHVLLWVHTEPDRLGHALAAIKDQENELFVSAATAWEISIKYALGKLPLPEPPSTWVPSRTAGLGAVSLPVDQAAAVAVADLPPVHRDPFDRMLVVQCAQLGARLVTADRVFEGYPVECVALW